MPEIITVPGVEDDLTEHYRYILRAGQPDAAERLLDAFSNTLDTLQLWPNAGRRLQTENPQLTSIRVLGLCSPFQAYQVFYVSRDDQVRVLAVLHCSLHTTTRESQLQARAE